MNSQFLKVINKLNFSDRKKPIEIGNIYFEKQKKLRFLKLWNYDTKNSYLTKKSRHFLIPHFFLFFPQITQSHKDKNGLKNCLCPGWDRWNRKKSYWRIKKFWHNRQNYYANQKRSWTTWRLRVNSRFEIQVLHLNLSKTLITDFNLFVYLSPKLSRKSVKIGKTLDNKVLQK